MLQLPTDKKIFSYLLQAVLIIFLIYFGKVVAAADDKIVLLGICLVAVYVLYRIDFELFILSTLIINNEFFYLAPREPIGSASYQDILFLILPLILTTYAIKRITVPQPFHKFIFVFFVVIVIAVFSALLQGQPLSLGLKAAKGYYLLLFYFVFLLRKIDYDRLTRLTVITGVLLMILNNIQYLGWGSVHIFQYSLEYDLERAGKLRFLMGDFFTIFAPILAFGAYLKQKKTWYLVASIYMAGTVVIQGQTRAVIFGLIITTISMLYLSQRIRFKMFFLSLASIVVFILFAPQIEETFISDLYKETTIELIKKSGNVGVRFDAYNYYWKELAPFIVTGRGIWNDKYTENNPEDRKFLGMHLTDIGIMGYLFHTGLIGAVWLFVLFKRVYHLLFESLNKLRDHVDYGIVGYFIFSLTTLATLNTMVQRYTIIYLALALAIVSNYDSSSSESDIV